MFIRLKSRLNYMSLVLGTCDGGMVSATNTHLIFSASPSPFEKFAIRINFMPTALSKERLVLELKRG